MDFLLTNSITFLSIFKKYAINTPRRIAHFLAQVHEESGGYIKFNESLNYTPQGLIKTFGTNQISVAQANLYGRTTKQKANQEAIANIVYRLINAFPIVQNQYLERSFCFRSPN